VRAQSGNQSNLSECCLCFRIDGRSASHQEGPHRLELLQWGAGRRRLGLRAEGRHGEVTRVYVYVEVVVHFQGVFVVAVGLATEDWGVGSLDESDVLVDRDVTEPPVLVVVPDGDVTSNKDGCWVNGGVGQQAWRRRWEHASVVRAGDGTTALLSLNLPHLSLSTVYDGFVEVLCVVHPCLFDSAVQSVWVIEVFLGQVETVEVAIEVLRPLPLED